MVRPRGYIAAMMLAGSVSAFIAVPAIGAASNLLRQSVGAPVSLTELGSIASFTPSIRDERWSSAFGKASLSHNARNFRFTPTSGSMSGRRSITVLVRADSNIARSAERSASPVAIAPLAFNLDASRGWRKFAMAEAVGRKPLDPVSTEMAGARNFSLEQQKSEKGGSRLKANVQFDPRRDIGTTPQSLAVERSYGVDLGSSYSLTRNLNVTAGVRYSGPDNRLAPITDQRQDNQAVYIGTIFKF